MVFTSESKIKSGGNRRYRVYVRYVCPIQLENTIDIYLHAIITWIVNICIMIPDTISNVERATVVYRRKFYAVGPGTVVIVNKNGKIATIWRQNSPPNPTT